jgi:MGT family glycosyltransferase
MSNILFINGNLHGHVHPTLPLVRELAARGENIWYFGADSFFHELEAAGAVPLKEGEELKEFYSTYRPAGSHPFFTILEYMIRLDEILIPVILRLWKEKTFDFIIYDSVLGAGQFLGQILSIPVVGSFSSFALSRLPLPDEMLQKGFHPQLDEFYARLEALCFTYGLVLPDSLTFFKNQGDLNIVYTSKEFNPGSELLDDSYKFISPLIRDEAAEDFPVEALKGKKVIYISMGTINNQLLDFYNMCMEAFEAFDGIVVLSIGKKCQVSDFPHVPDNFMVRQYVPQLEILKHASLFLTHGGLNSVGEAINYGVPMLLFPLMNDQFLTAKQAAGKGCGIVLDMKKMTASIVREKANEVLDDPDYRKSCKVLRQSFLETGGIKKAADYIEEFISAQKEAKEIVPEK